MVVDGPLDELEEVMLHYSEVAASERTSDKNLLKGIHRSVDQPLTKYITSLYGRADALYWGLHDLAKDRANHDKRAQSRYDSHQQQANKALKEINKELEEIDRRLASLPAGSKDRLKLLQRHLVLEEELQRFMRVMQKDIDEAAGSVADLERLLPMGAHIQHTAEMLQRESTKSLLRLSLIDMVNKLTFAVPVASALVITLAIDRPSERLGSLASGLGSNQPHTSALLIAFAVQVLIFTPITDWLSSRLVSRNLKAALVDLSSLVSQMRSLKLELTEAENQFSCLQAQMQATTN